MARSRARTTIRHQAIGSADRTGRNNETMGIASSLNAAFTEIYALRNVAGSDEDPNVTTTSYASPPCYMHELVPEYADHPPATAVTEFMRSLYDCWNADIPVLIGLRDAISGDEISKSLSRICLEDINFCRYLRESIAADTNFASIAAVNEYPCRLTAEGISEALRALAASRNSIMQRMCKELPRLTDERLRSAVSEMIGAHQHRAHVIAVAEALFLLNNR